MAQIFTETFETTPGYDNVWSDVTSGEGNSIDPDYDTSNLSSPIGWGSECLKIDVDVVSNNAAVRHDLDEDPEDDLYIRAYFQVDEGTLSALATYSGYILTIIHVLTTGGSSRFTIGIVYDGANYVLRNTYTDDGGGNSDDSAGAITFDTPYYIEAMYNYAGGGGNSSYEWKLNGVTQGSDSGLTLLTGSRRIQLGGCNVPGTSICIDNVSVDDEDWLGPVVGRQKVDGYSVLVNGGLHT